MIVITNTVIVTPQTSVTIFLTVRFFMQLTSFIESNYRYYSNVNKDYFSSSEHYVYMNVKEEQTMI